MRAKSANTTAELRKQNFEMTVAPGVDGAAKGELYLDDGESLEVGDQKSQITFNWNGQALEASGTFGYATDVVVERVVVLGDGASRTHEGPWGLHEAFAFHL
jgi:alpha-glucosidase